MVDLSSSSLSVRSGGSLAWDLILLTGERCGGDGEQDLDEDGELDPVDPDLSDELDLSRSFTCLYSVAIHHYLKKTSLEQFSFSGYL